jgi:ornithine decarboxylase
MTKNMSLGNAQRQNKALNKKKISYNSLPEALAALRPARPLYAVYPQVIENAARQFVSAFPGKTLYAIKTNPEIQVLEALSRGGVQAYDVASIEEIRTVKSRFPGAEIYFMHTVKAPEDIREAYFGHGVRNFVLDCTDELYKILRETDLAQDLNLFVRLSLPKNDKAFIDFSSKFGASRAEAVELLKQCRPVANALGVSFHVGTQTTEAVRYAYAIAYAADVIAESGVKIDALNVGGGFPVPYADGVAVCSIADCVDVIKAALEDAGLSDIPLMAEPGRILVAQGVKLVTRVELRKNDLLYINDGIYGGLFDACEWLGLRYPVKAFSCDRAFDQGDVAFRLAGPTCDSLDMMQGPFMLPNDIGMGDWVVFDNTGAYSVALRSNFNGFGHADTVCIEPSDHKR